MIWPRRGHILADTATGWRPGDEMAGITALRCRFQVAGLAADLDAR
jgi:hypothetical protein